MIGVDTTLLIQLAVTDLPEHGRAVDLLRREVQAPRERLALTPQVVNEFIHGVTDPKRFRRPLLMSEAIDFGLRWWNSIEVEQVFPDAAATDLFLHWMRQHRLGRKRLLDTQLAATLWGAGVRRIISSNAAGFRLLGFEVVTP